MPSVRSWFTVKRTMGILTAGTTGYGSGQSKFVSSRFGLGLAAFGAITSGAVLFDNQVAATKPLTSTTKKWYFYSGLLCGYIIFALAIKSHLIIQLTGKSSNAELKGLKLFGVRSSEISKDIASYLGTSLSGMEGEVAKSEYQFAPKQSAYLP